MTTVVQYLHGPNWVPTAITAYSVRQNGGLGAEHVLYSTDQNVLDNPYLPMFFDCVAWPIWDWKALWRMDLCWERNHPCHDGRIPAWPSDFRKYALAKYSCFWHEPGDVLYLDNDILCVGDVTEVFPKAPQKWSARYWRSNGSPRLNGGVLAKLGDCEAEDFLLPLTNQAAMNEAFQIHRLDDEACASWSMIRHGTDDLYCIPLIYNKNVASAIPPGVRMLHFNAPEKPWFGRFLDISRPQYEMWTETARTVMALCGYPEDGEGVEERFRWPFRLGEWQPKRQKMGMRF